MKILSVNAGLPLGENNAMWHRVSKMNDIMIKAGHDVQVIHYWDNKFYRYYLPKYKENIMEFIQNNPDHIFVKGSSIEIFIKHLKYLSKNFDLVYANNNKATIYSIIGKLKKTPLIYDMHGGLVEEFSFRNNHDFTSTLKLLQLKLVNSLNLNLPNKIICVSKCMINHLIKNGVSRNKLEYVTNGVDLDYFKPFSAEEIQKNRESLNLDDKMVFGYIGGFHKWQGVENFIKAAKNIDDRDVSFLVVGGKEYKKSENLLMIPKIPFEDVKRFYSVCDVLVLPRPDHIATQIAAPTKFAEYIAMGKPILTTEVGDAALFVKKYKCGAVLKNNELNNLIKGITILKNKSDYEIKEMGENARKLAEDEFNWKKIEYNLLKVVNEI